MGVAAVREKKEGILFGVRKTENQLMYSIA